MFQVVVVLEMMTVGKGVANKWQQSVGQNFGDVELGVHCSIENNESSWPSFRNASPHVYFQWMLRFSF